MKRMVARIAGLAALVGLLWAPSANASTHVFVQIGSRPPVYAPVPVYGAVAVPVQYRSGYVWEPGYYIRVSYRQRRWVPGRWVRAPYARRWWRFRGHGRRWDRGRRGGVGFEFRYRSR